MNETREITEAALADGATLVRVGTALAVAAAGHVLVLVLRQLGRSVARTRGRLTPKIESVIGLAISAAVFAIYFFALGYVLTELGVPISAYIASASVIGLAVGFGSQSVVQDVVTGLTLIFSDLVAVGQMVSIGGQSGRVQSVGIRFTTLRNPQGALIHVPNRSVTNVVTFPSGYLRCLVDVQLLGDEAQRVRVIAEVEAVVDAVQRQFPGIHVLPPSAEGRFGDARGREYHRTKFRLWPDRGDLITAYVREELLHRSRRIDADYAQWMIAVAFEIEDRAPGFRVLGT